MNQAERQTHDIQNPKEGPQPDEPVEGWVLVMSRALCT